MIGRTVGSYRMTGKIGDGGMGAVFLAVDDMLGREVAVKVLHPELARQPDLVERFRDEAVTLARLSHPNITTLYGLLREGPELFMVMEYVRGQTLEDLLAGAGWVSWERAARFGVQILSALDYAHRSGVIHRDLKPANLMLTRDGTIKVMDFGIARVMGAARRTREGHSVGTLTYMAPEQIRGQEGDGRCDLYAMGIVLYELVTGRPPFTSEDEYALMQAQIEAAPVHPSLVAADVPSWLDAAILKALSKDPAERFQTAAAFRDVLERGVRATPARGYPAAGTAGSPGPIEIHEIKETRLAPGLAGAEAATAGGTASEAPRTGLSDASGDPAAIRETRLAPELAAAPVAAGIKETRLASELAAGQSAGSGASDPTRRTGLPGAREATLRRLNWRHYAGAAAVFVSLGVVAVLLVWSFGKDVQEPRQPAASEQAATASPVPGGTSGGAAPLPSTTEPARPEPTAPPAATSPPDRLPTTWLPPAETTKRPPAVRPPAPTTRPPVAAPPAEVKPAPEPPAPPVGEPEATPAVSRPEARPTPPPLPAMTFQRIQAMILAGEKSREKDASLRLEERRLAVVIDDDGSVLKAFDYEGIRSVTYSQSKHPRWKEGGAAAVGAGIFALPVFFLKSTRHWLTVQTDDDFVVLRLDKNDYRTIIPAVEARTGLKVEMLIGDK